MDNEMEAGLLQGFIRGAPKVFLGARGCSKHTMNGDNWGGGCMA